MIRSMSSFVVLSSLLGATAVFPASAQTTPAVPAVPTDPAAPAALQAPAPAAAAPTLVIVTSPAASPKSDADKSAQAASKASYREAFFEAHLAALRAGLMLTPDQEKLWPPVEQSIRTMANIKVDARQAVNRVLDPQDDENETGRSDGASDPSLETDPFLAVKAASALLLERGKALQSLADASGPLYGSLSTDQKGRLPILVRSFAPNNIKLRQFLALLTLDTTLQKHDGMMRRTDKGEQPGSRGGLQGRPQDEQQTERHALQPEQRQDRYGRRQLDGGEMNEGPGKGQASGEPDARYGYGMMRPRADDETPYDSDE